MASLYHENSTINGTIPRRPIRPITPLGLVDYQSLPPRGWCVTCGGEIYRPNREKCPKCRPAELRIDN